VRLHETDFTWGEERNLVGRAFRTFWNLPTNVSVHSQREKELLAASTGRAPDRIEVMHHGRNFVRRTSVDRAEARRQLGIDTEQFMFLAIGFVQPHKGFDRAVRAFDGLGDDGKRRLDVVGSVRVDEPEYLAYAESLERLADATPGAHVHLGYLSDEQFDVWLVAADMLLLPYHFIWSSGVLERAALYGRPVIAMRVGGLEGQAAGADVRLVEDDRELALAMREVAGVTVDDADVESWPEAAAGADRRAIQATVGRRADRLGIDTDLTDAPGIDGDIALRQLPPLAVAPPVAHGIVRKKLKAVVRKLTAWEIDPIVAHVNTLQRATIDATYDERDGGDSR
jgi:glycosyltransferase involved in cell wall biosynthesis